MSLNRILSFSLAAFVVAAIAIPQSSIALEAPKEKEKKEAKKEDPREGRPVTDLKQFMRTKLSASNKILEGLVTEDMVLVREGAKTLNKMSLSEKWRVNNDTMYKQFSAEFRRITNDLNKAAEEENVDQVALKWMGTTMACIECHRFVRNALIVDKEALK